jgi:uncharacterized protein (TIGR02231 family)
MPDKRTIKNHCVSVILAAVFLSPAHAWSAPNEVTFFPDSAYVQEVAKVTLHAEDEGLRKAIIILPGQADPDSLTVNVRQDSKMRIEDMAWRQIIRQDDARIATFRTQLDNLKDERKSLQSSIRALDIQVQFWQLQTKAKVKTVADAHNMSAAIGKNVKKSYQDKLTQEGELEKLDKKIKEAQDEFDRAAGKKETAWEITILLSGSKNVDTTLSYTYSLSECGWHPLYRLEAHPQNKKISFTWEAEIWQSTGQDWKNVNINLATLKPPRVTHPGELMPWIIKPRSFFRSEAVRKKAMKAEAADEREGNVGVPAAAPPAPKEIKQSTYSRWQLGKKNIPAGAKQKVKIQEESWPSEFAYLTRPSQNNQVFVRASVNLTEQKEIPSGSCSFVMDGAILGKREFALFGNEAIVFFGVDPLITVKAQLLSKKSGEKTFLQGKQTYAWDWQIDVQNSRTSPVRVILEEPTPQPRDERISVTFTHNPEPAEKTFSSLIWNLDIPGGQKKSIFTSVRIEAPHDMVLDLGWRQ